MNRFIAKLVHGVSRLAFWRKPAASTPEEAESLATPEPATAPQSRQAEAESSAAEDVPVLQTGWLARLKSKFRRPPEHVQPEADEDTPRSRAVESATDEAAAHVSRIQHVRAVLTNKWVWVPGISVMLIAIIATMMWMLVQSGQDKKQLQLELVAAQKKLKQASAAKVVAIKPVVAHPDVHEQAGKPAVVAAGDTPSGSRLGADAGGCDVSNKGNVTQNLKNCIDSFNAMAE